MPNLLAEIQRLLPSPPLTIAITGSGGKTTCMELLAHRYAREGKRVLISTTTKLAHPDTHDYGCTRVFLDTGSIMAYTPKDGDCCLYGIVEGKLVAPPMAVLETLRKKFDVLIVEADGSRRLGLKIHTSRDPVVPPWTDATIAIASFSTIGKPFATQCFGHETQPEAFPEYLVDETTFKKLLLHPEGIVKRARGTTIVLCNQASKADEPRCRTVCEGLDVPYSLLFGSLLEDTLIHRNTV